MDYIELKMDERLRKQLEDLNKKREEEEHAQQEEDGPSNLTDYAFLMQRKKIQEKYIKSALYTVIYEAVLGVDRIRVENAFKTA